LKRPLILEGKISRSPNLTGSDTRATLLRLITPDLNRLPIWIWIVVTSLRNKLSVIKTKPEEVEFG
jgi:hypothetical protein